jgi:hypothetical protein
VRPGCRGLMNLQGCWVGVVMCKYVSAQFSCGWLLRLYEQFECCSAGVVLRPL